MRCLIFNKRGQYLYGLRMSKYHYRYYTLYWYTKPGGLFSLPRGSISPSVTRAFEIQFNISLPSCQLSAPCSPLSHGRMVQIGSRRRTLLMQ